MAVVDSLRRVVASARAQLSRAGAARHWVLLLPDNLDIPAAIAEQMRSYDTYHIDSVMAEYWTSMLGDNEPGSCTVLTDSGNFIVDMTDGHWTLPYLNWNDCSIGWK